MLCEVLYVVLSLMGGYYTQGTSLSPTESYKKGFGERALFTEFHAFKKGHAARICSQKQCATAVIWRGRWRGDRKSVV